MALKDGSQSETQIQKQITDYLKLRRVFFYRTNNMPQRKTSKGSDYYTQNVPGLPDLFLCLPNGRACYVEVKSKDGQQTELQKRFEEDAVKNQIHFIVTRDLDNFRMQFDPLLKECLEDLYFPHPLSTFEAHAVQRAKKQSKWTKEYNEICDSEGIVRVRRKRRDCA